jgi:hypothetical protein
MDPPSSFYSISPKIVSNCNIRGDSKVGERCGLEIEVARSEVGEHGRWAMIRVMDRHSQLA